MSFTIIIIVSIAWVIATTIFFLLRKNKEPKAVVIDNTRNNNVFSQSENQIQKLKVSLVYNDSNEIDKSELADLVIPLKELLEKKSGEIKEIKSDSFKPKELQVTEEAESKEESKTIIEKKSDINFNKIISIKTIKNK